MNANKATVYRLLLFIKFLLDSSALSFLYYPCTLSEVTPKVV